MNIFKYITNREYRLRQKRLRAEDLLRQRHMEMNRHVHIQDVYHYNGDTYIREQWLTVDGLRIKRYKIDDYAFYRELYHRYYVLHRHELLIHR